MADLRDDNSSGSCDYGNSLKAFFAIDKSGLRLDFERVYASNSAYTLEHLQEFYSVIKNAYAEILK